MEAFFNLIFGFPTALFTVLLGVALIFWVLAIVGVIDFDHGHLHFDVGHHVEPGHADSHEIESLGAIVTALGLGGVPFSIVLSLIAFCGWIISALAQDYLLALLPAGPLRWLAGTGVLVGAFALSLPFTALAIRPLRPLFVVHRAQSNAGLVGMECRIVTMTVDERFGRAEVETAGVSHNIRVWAKTPNLLKNGSVAQIVDFNPQTGQYQVSAL